MEQQQTNGKKVIYLNQVAAMIGVTTEYARTMAVAGQLPCFRYKNRGRWRAFKEDIDKFLEDRRSSSTSGQVKA